jgi:chromosomal replication initiation ATPase DnaA
MAEVTFPHENVMNLKLPAAFVPEMVEQKLKEDLYNIFAHRCGFDVTIVLEYEAEANYKKNNNEDFYIEQQIKNMLESVKNEEEESSK